MIADFQVNQINFEHIFLPAVDTSGKNRYCFLVNYETADFFHRLLDTGFRLVVMEEPPEKGRQALFEKFKCSKPGRVRRFPVLISRFSVSTLSCLFLHFKHQTPLGLFVPAACGPGQY